MALLHLGPGLANASAALHNARRAASPVLALVGDMATWHVSYDPLLAAPIARLAGCVSRHVVVCGGAGEGHGAQGGAEAGGRSGADGGGGIRAADDSEQGAVARGVVEALSALAEEAAAGAGGGGGGDGCGGSGGQGDGLEPVRGEVKAGRWGRKQVSAVGAWVQQAAAVLWKTSIPFRRCHVHTKPVSARATVKVAHKSRAELHRFGACRAPLPIPIHYHSDNATLIANPLPASMQTVAW